MAITKNIIDMLNGEISVTSKKGEGTQFVVTVTLVDSDHGEDDEAMEVKSHSISEGAPVSLIGKRILLAEDIEVNARIMMKILDLFEHLI